MIDSGFRASSEELRTGASVGRVISMLLVLVPFVIMFGLALLILGPSTRKLGIWLILENHPIEMLTSAMAFWASIEGLRLFNLTLARDGLFVRRFILFFAIMMFIFAMEEISWGQQLFNFSTPDFWKVRNTQQELTLHNYKFVGVSYLEVYPLIFAIGGLVGIWIRAKGILPWVMCPPAPIWSWFAVVVVHCSIDLSHEYYIWSPAFDDLINLLDEVAEFMVACSALLYLFLNRRSFVLNSSRPPF